MKVHWVGGPLTQHTARLLEKGTQPGQRPPEKTSPFAEGFILELWANLLPGPLWNFLEDSACRIWPHRACLHQFCMYEVLLFPKSSEPRKERAPLTRLPCDSLLWMGGCCPLVVLGDPAPDLTGLWSWEKMGLIGFRSIPGPQVSLPSGTWPDLSLFLSSKILMTNRLKQDHEAVTAGNYEFHKLLSLFSTFFLWMPRFLPAVWKEHPSGSQFMLKCQSQWVFLNRNKGIAKKRKREQCLIPEWNGWGRCQAPVAFLESPHMRPLLSESRG